MPPKSTKSLGYLVDLTGLRFGSLVAIEKSERRSNRGDRPYWTCRCDCGVVKDVDRRALRSGDTKTCGHGLNGRMRIKSVRHGLSVAYRKEAKVWKHMIQRCTNPNYIRWKNYGGRGIRICDRWRESFEAFFADMGVRPSPSHSIDRIDNDGDYCPENCRWATPKEQANNKRSTRFLEYDGQSRRFSEWSKITGISIRVLHGRLRRGWTAHETLTTPLLRRGGHPKTRQRTLSRDNVLFVES